MSSKPVVAVAMSGGVDSSVAAALLVEQGYSVVGMMLKLWSDVGTELTNRCCTPDSMAMARRVASILSIPFYVLDARQIFFDTVVQSFIHDYASNLTPNPCVECNRHIRWEFLLNQALSAGAEFLATGHYARLSRESSGNYLLHRGVDPTKDQSYVLHVLTQQNLSHALFPLGSYTKGEVRQIAHRLNLPVAEIPDSQDLCFIGGDGDYRQFLSHYAPETQTPGDILDQQGKVLGQHPGLVNFTIGQRKGLNISSPSPLYVIDKDTENNTLIVGEKDHMGKDHLIAEGMNWIAGQPPAETFSAQVKIRYKSRDLPCRVSSISEDSVLVRFDTMLRDITPGQAAVLYNGDICLGGGTIAPEPRRPSTR